MFSPILSKKNPKNNDFKVLQNLPNGRFCNAREKAHYERKYLFFANAQKPNSKRKTPKPR